MSTRRSNVIDNLVAERIRTHRKKLGLSQSELAERLGISFQQVQKYERGINRVGAGRLFEIARLFEVPIQALFPEPQLPIKHANSNAKDLKAISDFMLSVDGWKLFHAFLEVGDPRKRK